MLMLFQAIRRLYKENVAVAAQRFSFNDIVTRHMRKFLTLEKRKCNCRKSGMHMDCAIVEHIITVQDNPR